ncbi:MAG: DUF4832 domain-containing protein [Armatimonadetes bacterium]|nr:DUF4832 domain-containing protein [Armatimonadota bacterium]MDW8122794.1 DUF4832 domain-containing protein [Armatimonadota bacterium]
MGSASKMPRRKWCQRVMGLALSASPLTALASPVSSLFPSAAAANKSKNEESASQQKDHQKEVRQLVVEPQESEEVLSNPGMGWQTFHCFANEDRTLEGLPSSCAYFRFMWKELEPEEGRINYDFMDGLLERAARAGQTLAFRIMNCGTDEAHPSYSPKWLEARGITFFSYHYDKSGPFTTPDLDSPRCLDYHLRLIHLLGERYDGHPLVDHVDIGSVGLWGEWHMAGTSVSMPRPETCQKIIDAHLTAFPKTPKLMLIGGDQVLLPGGQNALQYAVGKGAGWRADCLGDLGGFSPAWNHMRDYYPKAIERGKAQDAWKFAPVAFESCWDMRKWVQEGWDVRYIFDYALDYHASYLNNKSAPLPSGVRTEIERFLRRLGYRLVLRKAQFPEVCSQSLNIHLQFENVGVAPPYRDYFLCLRLQNPSRSVTVPTTVSVKGWLPGPREVSLNLPLPSLPADSYALSLSIISPYDKQPFIQLANKGVDLDLWLKLGTVRIVRE